MAEVKLYRDTDFRGGSVTLSDDNPNLKDLNFNDVVSSVEVVSGTFTLFQNINFDGYSLTVSSKGGPESDGRYPSPQWMANRNDVVSSVRKNAS